MEQLPPVNRLVLKRVLQLLNTVYKSGVEAASLSLVFSHALLRTNVMSKYSVKDDFQDGKGKSPINYCVEWLITNAERFV